MGDWQVPLAWARPLPVFCGEWVRGRPVPVPYQTTWSTSSPRHGLTFPGVWTRSTQSPLHAPPGHVHPGAGRDTRVYRWEGTYKWVRLGDSRVLSL